MRNSPVVSLIVCIFVVSCVAQDRLEENSKQLTRILKIRYKNDDRKVKTLFNKLTKSENAKNEFASRTFTDKELTKFFEAKVGSYETWYLRVRKLWDDFETKAVTMYPHLEVFIGNFTENFLWYDKINEYKIKKFTESKQTMKNLLPSYVNRYLRSQTIGSMQLVEANMLQIRDILEKDFNIKGSAQDFVAQHEKKYKKLCSDPKYLFDRASLKAAVEPSQFELCAILVDAEKENHLMAGDATLLEEMKKYFASEKCAAREICSQNSSTALEFLAKKLEPYTAWFHRFSGVNWLDENENLKDEIDLAVFNSIENILKEKNYSDKNIKCIIEFMMRTQSVDKIFSKDLFFDETSLNEEVKTIVTKYRELYPEIV